MSPGDQPTFDPELWDLSYIQFPWKLQYLYPNQEPLETYPVRYADRDNPNLLLLEDV
jgi:hypothetical protein